MPYTLPGTFVDGSTTVPVSATNLNEYTAAITDLDLRAPIRGAFTNPNGNVVGSPGNVYENTSGGAGITLWVKETGSGTNTGWVAAGAGGGSSLTIANQATNIPSHPTLNFGSGITAAENTSQNRIDVTSDVGFAPCDVATTTGITPTGIGFVVDGVTITAGMRVLNKDDTAANRGIYIAASAAWTRAQDMPPGATVKSGLTVTVRSGTRNGGMTYFLLGATSTAPTVLIGTDNMSFRAVNRKIQASGASISTRTVLNFTGAGVTVTDDLTNDATNVTIPGGGSGSLPITTKGDLVIGDATGTPIRLPIGANNGVLTPDSTAANGIKWATGPSLFVTSTGFSDPGDLAVGTGAGTFSVLPGTVVDGFVLTSDSTAPPTTLKWAPLNPVPVTLTFSTVLTTNAGLANLFRVTATANFTLSNPTNLTDGQRITWEIIQDGTGNRTITLGSNFVLGTTISSVTLSTTAGKRDFLTGVVNIGTGKIYVVELLKGY